MNIDDLFLDPDDGSVGDPTDVEEAGGDTKTPALDGSSEVVQDTISQLPDINQDDGHESGDEAHSIAESDSSDVAFNKTEAKVDALFDRYGPAQQLLFLISIPRHRKFHLRPSLFLTLSRNSLALETLLCAFITMGHRSISLLVNSRTMTSSTSTKWVLIWTCSIMYPNGVTGSSWLYQGPDYYGMTFSTAPIFANVPSGRMAVIPATRLQGDYLAPVNRVQDEYRQRNREALEVTSDNMHNLSLLANWPDPDGHICNLGENIYLGPVRVKQPDVFNYLEVAQLREEQCLAEEAVRLREVAARAESMAERKHEREECLKSMWHAMSSSTLGSSPASAASLSSTMASFPVASSSLTTSPSKRKATEDPPTSPSLPKRQTTRMSTGGKPPKKVSMLPPSTKGSRSMRSKGKAKAEDAMEVDA
ncbi:hypothetical protein BT96DRAFT_1003194 [Gymnopus androsaceus JB14]|uniref:Uncharacterized protein n=1 Tax=Gymnopus androsaceus JB14 TaxID=1447944 RepID=A0A6A4GVH4_9AGAR|nr:hypothetical protein BT96DRAFT_1003194 [Gymnopus androsaceus JB14]